MSNRKPKHPAPLPALRAEQPADTIDTILGSTAALSDQISEIDREKIEALAAPQKSPRLENYISSANAAKGVLYTLDEDYDDSRQYCDACGHVDAHAQGCPAARQRALLQELEAEEMAEANPAAQQTAPEPIAPLVRRIGASLLVRLARWIEPPK